MTAGRPGKASTPEGRLRVYIVLAARRAGWSERTLYEGLSQVLGRRLVRGWGLTTCTKPELVELADWITAATGGVPGRHRRGGRERRGPGWQRDPTGVVVRLATRPQRDLIERLGRELFGATSPGSAFAHFLAGMVGKTEARLLTIGQASKVIEALMDMSRRGWRPRAAERSPA